MPSGSTTKYCAVSRSLARAEQLAAERSAHECAAGAARSMHHHDRVADHAGGVALWLAERDVVKAEFGQRFARLELEILGDVVAAGARLRNGGRRAHGYDRGRAAAVRESGEEAFHVRQSRRRSV